MFEFSIIHPVSAVFFYCSASPHGLCDDDAAHYDVHPACDEASQPFRSQSRCTGNWCHHPQCLNHHICELSDGPCHNQINICPKLIILIALNPEYMDIDRHSALGSTSTWSEVVRKLAFFALIHETNRHVRSPCFSQGFSITGVLTGAL